MRAAALALAVALLASDEPLAQRRYIESPAAPLYREGMELLSDEHWREAADTFERAIDLDESYALAFYGLGRARIGEKQFVAAVSALERCSALYLAVAGDRSTREMDLAQHRRDRIMELRDYLRQLLSGPQRTNTGLLAQQIQDQIDDLELATRDGVSDLMLRVPAFVSLSLGSAHFRSGAMTNAERAYRNAIAANPKMGEAHNNLAVVLLLTGRAADAEKSIKAAERNGFRVSPQLKQDIQIAMRDERQ
jgi:tetratricopeptide (TPR) repeat protein